MSAERKGRADGSGVSSAALSIDRRTHSFVFKPAIGGWGIVMCRHCRKHFKYRQMGFATEYPSTEGCHARA